MDVEKYVQHNIALHQYVGNELRRYQMEGKTHSAEVTEPVWTAAKVKR